MTGVGAVIGSFMKDPEDAGPTDAFYYGTSAIEGLAAGAMLVVISNAMYVRCIITSQPTRIDPLRAPQVTRSLPTRRKPLRPLCTLRVPTHPFYHAAIDYCELTMRYLPPPPKQGFWLLSSWSSPTSGKHYSNRIPVGCLATLWRRGVEVPRRGVEVLLYGSRWFVEGGDGAGSNPRTVNKRHD